MKHATLGIILLLMLVGSSVAQSKPAGNCWETANTQSELNACADEDARQAEAELNRVYQQLLANAEGDDDAIAKIREAQRAWVAFRDAQLQASFPSNDKQGAYGTMYPMCYANLATEMTQQRIVQLRNMVKSWSDAGCWE